MSIKDDVFGFVVDVAEDVESRMENIKAVKGQTFLDCVEFMLACHNIIQIGASNMPQEIRHQILMDMVADFSGTYLKKTLPSKEECHEAIKMAKDINSSLSSHAARVTEMMKQFKVSDDD